MIYFDIQDFGECKGAVWLAKKLDHRQAIIRLSLDGKDEQIVNARTVTEAEIKRSPLLIVDRSLPVRWCGPSQVTNFISSVARALDFSGWHYFVNLSGACFPTRPVSDLIDVLISGQVYGRQSSISRFRVNQSPTLLEQGADSEYCVVTNGRLHVSGQKAFLERFFDPQNFPVRHVANRQFVRCAEPKERELPLSLHQPLSSEIEEIQRYFFHTGLYAGRAWYALTREFCEKLLQFLDSTYSSTARDIFLNSFEPDETFLQTIAWSGLFAPSESLANASLHYNHGTVVNFNTVGDLSDPSLKETFFARKLVSQEARDAASALFSGGD